MNIFELFGTIAIKNRDANNALNETAQKAERTGKRIQEAFKKVGATTLKIGKGLAAGATAVGTAFAATVEKTRDYRTAMGKLETAYVTNGHSAETALKTYRALQSVLGDTDQAVEAANHLAVLCKNEEDLAKWTDICTGVYATFGDSLPIEGLTESANETAKVGQVTGSLADALNWAGISEEDFNKKLRACRTEQERQNLIVNHLTHAYKNASDQYKQINADIIAANEAQEKLNSAMGTLGKICEPSMSALKTAVADMVIACAPYVEMMVSDIALIVEEFVNVITWAEKAAYAVADFFGSGNLGGVITFGGGTSEGSGTGRSFAGGLDYVPMDSYVARLHKGEAVLDKTEAEVWRGGGSGRIEALLSQLVANTSGGQQIVLESGVLVGQIASQMDARLGTISSRKGRGN